MSWVAEYVGLPALEHGRDRQGCDCWGLARLVYREQLGIDLPSYSGDYAGTEERHEIAHLIGIARVDWPWREVLHLAPFDMLLFRRGRLTCHIGVVIDARRMLHMDATDHAKVADFRTGRWATRRTGAYRHVQAPMKVTS
ncbi:NlpC/P60 family protein [Limimaricola variabilis]|uniref:C40 family peptidase n=1 Tax=Limimaricola variabilis TaxID=1492771 RepID=UPI002AC9853E|nr:NlpC/P60 family protein [Limimaricola variabilis]WPY94671.1 NlpC/P60 family protein [Limimaricola variabilis]